MIVTHVPYPFPLSDIKFKLFRECHASVTTSPLNSHDIPHIKLERILEQSNASMLNCEAATWTCYTMFKALYSSCILSYS